LISTSRAHCFSVGSFRGIPAATVMNESSVGVRSCRSRTHAWSARQDAGPSSTTDVCICMPVMKLCCAWASFFALVSSSRALSSLPSSYFIPGQSEQLELFASGRGGLHLVSFF
jgi:hypothetical protein